MAKPTKFFRIATEGATSDGRVIDRETLVQMADSYDPKVYTARVNLEHIRGYDPAGTFKAYGDVTALKAEEQDGKMRLLAQLDPTDDLVAMTKARQKIFSSMEVQPSFADTGEAYLVGLAVTDNPASLGCEVLQFSAQAKASPLAARKQHPDNLFTEAVEIDLDFSEPITYTPVSAPANLADSIKRLFSKQRKADDATDARFADVQEAVQTVAQQVQAMGDRFDTAIKGVNDQLAAFKTQGDARDKQFRTLRAGLEKTDAYTARPPATGGDGTGAVIKTDC
ncbi:GPO family capsid scaffolding protein [Ralstonia pseudosolanacearum]|uniref:GPO family capsid scaffolding protein n=1 Tax=Ralstonia pseudosolanacearum TaxID=1310165 RepID=UPI0007D7A11A|nr:GPO family capsid scaffolding protein [Ralstonia pseudosolanacearum]MDC6293974.1 GPO family capsid scaffolding protein [Ralstonia pseudosolanacearum]MDD7788871.1 GPO family capsid scaffolding protein [Ralstonia pseudosolanacearum]MDN3370098.1 GPO family capsid scaffolding protein [Ralstonia pseudosolanacearum]OAK91072.1 phage capsid scaffolding protein [Ralstonia pseudosolanacearum]QOK88469.1 GPO family capsid scaffolding protein [Ralstonia pseudosolanacearum]